LKKISRFARNDNFSECGGAKSSASGGRFCPFVPLKPVISNERSEMRNLKIQNVPLPIF
jgi:hypothetical protein